MSIHVFPVPFVVRHTLADGTNVPIEVAQMLQNAVKTICFSTIHVHKDVLSMYLISFANE